MAFTVGATPAKDGAGATIAGGLLSADVAGGGVGPTFLFHGMVDGVAGINKAQVTAANALKVDSSAVTQPVSVAAAATSIGKAEDVASVDADVGVPAYAILKATPADTAGTDGDYQCLQMKNGRLWTDSNIRFAGTTPDLGTGTGGAATMRVAVDTAQLALALNSAQPMSATFQLVDIPTDGTGAVRLGSLTETAPATDTASSGINGRLQRIAQRLTTLLQPSAAANGATESRVNAAATTNATSLKASAGQLYEIDLFNVAAYTVFLKLYNKASAPTVGTDTPVMTIPIPAGGGYSKEWAFGKSFATGVAYAITKLQADSDTTAVAAGDLTGALSWI